MAGGSLAIYISVCDEMTESPLSAATAAAKALAHPARLRVLAMLSGGPLCVCQMTAVLGTAPVDRLRAPARAEAGRAFSSRRRTASSSPTGWRRPATRPAGCRWSGRALPATRLRPPTPSSSAGCGGFRSRSSPRPEAGWRSRRRLIEEERFDEVSRSGGSCGSRSRPWHRGRGAGSTCSRIAHSRVEPRRAGGGPEGGRPGDRRVRRGALHPLHGHAAGPSRPAGAPRQAGARRQFLDPVPPGGGPSAPDHGDADAGDLRRQGAGGLPAHGLTSRSRISSGS